MNSDNETKKKVLLVDDVKLFIELEKTFFQRKESIEVLVANNGVEALKMVEAERPDLVFMDLHMPEMNGDECCQKIKRSGSGREIPIVMVTSAGNDADKERCLAAGCDEIINKPINRLEFLSIAKKYLEVYERSAPRYAVHVKVMYGEDKTEVLSDFSVNLNTSGLFLESTNILPVDSLLDLEFSLPENDSTVACQARVAWINVIPNPSKKDLPLGMGLEFVGLSDDQVSIIEQYIRQNALSAEW
jgi:CheY-like chemotaxis protein